MNDQEMADAILAMMRLPPDKRSTVMYVVAMMSCGDGVTKSDPPPKEPVRFRAPNDGKRYSDDDNLHLRPIAENWHRFKTKEHRRKAVDDAAGLLGRSFDAAEKQIHQLKKAIKAQSQ